jgi:hypothetical protein
MNKNRGKSANSSLFFLLLLVLDKIEQIQWRWWPIGPRQGDLIFLVIVIATAFYIKKRAFPKQGEDPFFCASWA